jgi:hypothetical protein
MDFFFVQDFRRNYRFFSSEPVQEIQVEFSRLKKIWAAARDKLMLLPPRILRQEQAFEKVLKMTSQELSIHHAEGIAPKKIKRRFFFFLQKQRTKHILLLTGETILLPLSGLMALLPGPNVFFGVLALIMITHWQALRGINRLRKLTPRFIGSALLNDWEHTIQAGDADGYAAILTAIQNRYHISQAVKILYK